MAVIGERVSTVEWLTADRRGVLLAMYEAGIKAGVILDTLRKMPGGEVPSWENVCRVPQNAGCHRPAGFGHGMAARLPDDRRGPPAVRKGHVERAAEREVGEVKVRRPVLVTPSALRAWCEARGVPVHLDAANAAARTRGLPPFEVRGSV